MAVTLATLHSRLSPRPDVLLSARAICHTKLISGAVHSEVAICVRVSCLPLKRLEQLLVLAVLLQVVAELLLFLALLNEFLVAQVRVANRVLERACRAGSAIGHQVSLSKLRCSRVIRLQRHVGQAIGICGILKRYHFLLLRWFVELECVLSLR